MMIMLERVMMMMMTTIIVNEIIFKFFQSVHLALYAGGGGTPHIKGVGTLVGNFELNP